ncbi:hypothetical protein TYRP_003303 [Tyrophagus putrescentiae]|nr:hypothetical protein TYRP_003303 [Tyrophagus putrescentiae]
MVQPLNGTLVNDEDLQSFEHCHHIITNFGLIISHTENIFSDLVIAEHLSLHYRLEPMTNQLQAEYFAQWQIAEDHQQTVIT